MAGILAAVLVQHVAVYRARHRPAAELARLAEAALRPGGRVAVDSRTASLVLNGPRGDVERALELLAELDRRLRTLVIAHSVATLEDLASRSLRIDWSEPRASLRVGALVAVSRPNLRAGATHRAIQRELRSSLRLLEGEPGTLATGETRALPGGFGGELRAESGFEALPTLLASGRIRIELRPFDGRFEAGGVRYTAAATTLELDPGETVVVAETAEHAVETTLELPRGASGAEARVTRVLLLRVDLEP